MTFTCDICGKTFKYSRDFKLHQNRKFKCIPKDVDTTLCIFCNTRVATKQSLIRHLEKCDNKNIILENNKKQLERLKEIDMFQRAILNEPLF